MSYFATLEKFSVVTNLVRRLFLDINSMEPSSLKVDIKINKTCLLSFFFPVWLLWISLISSPSSQHDGQDSHREGDGEEEEELEDI